MVRLIADSNALGHSLRIIYFVHVLLDCNLFEISISYGFRNIKFTMPTAFGVVDRNLNHTYIIYIC